MIEFGFVVEGDGEIEAVPLLVRRIIAELDPAAPVAYRRPVRVTKSKMLRAAELERAIGFVRRGIQNAGAILVVLNADDDCPATLGPLLLAKARPFTRDCPLSVVVATREFESWFLAAAPSLSGRQRLKNGLRAPENVESIRGAKEWLRRNMAPGASYSPTVDQAKLAGSMSLAEARTAPSFDRCYREVERLLCTAQGL